MNRRLGDMVRDMVAAREDRPRDRHVPCDTPNCPGDGRYAAPGRRHLADCKYPRESGQTVPPVG